MKFSFDRKYLVALAITLLASSAVVVVGSNAVNVLRDNVAMAARTRSLALQLRKTLEAILDLETSQRGYLLTLEEPYLAPYRQAQATLDADLGKLGDLARSYPGVRSADIDKLRSLAAAKRAELARTIELAQGGQLTAALALVKGGQGQSVMNDIRSTLDGLNRQVERELDDARDAASASIDSARNLIAMLGAVWAVALGGIYIAMRAEMSVSRRAQRSEEQALASLEKRVEERTAEASRVATDLRVSERRLQNKLARLNLLDQITRAIGERQDMDSIYQVVVRSLEDRLPVDFCCVCVLDETARTLTVIHAGVRESALARGLAFGEARVIAVETNGLARCIDAGELIYEPDLGASGSEFAQVLAHAGLGCMVVAPLKSEGTVFGVLIAARTKPNSFDSGECEFMRQLSAHTGLAARQTELRDTLQRAYDELRQSQQAAMQEDRLRALGRMASGIAHDINNSIVPAVLHTDDLLERETGLSAEGRKQLQTVSRAIGDVAATVERMSELYRPRGSSQHRAAVSLNRLVPHVVDLTHARWSDMPQQRGIVIRAHCDLADDLPDVLGVESEIREVLVNLVFNAVDAMPDGGELTLRTRSIAPSGPNGKAAARLEVEDTGIGMDEETRRRCLEPFFTTKGDQGTGMGLAMVFGIVQRHGAQIDIRSEVGRGTIVAVRFDAAPVAQPIVEADASSLAGTAPPRQLRILVVDDDPLVLETLERMLRSGGDVVVAANGGQAGIDAFAGARAAGSDFSVVFTDLGMPHVDGRRVARAVKQMSPSTTTVLLTGWGAAGAGGEQGSDIDLVMSKPPKLRELREALSRLR